jgi:Uma2 family endonuclease
MATVESGSMTAAEFLAFVNRPENRGRHFELEEGEVVEMPPPGKYHGFVCGNVAVALHAYAAERRRGYVCTNDSGLVVEENPDTVRGPDVCFYDDDQSAADMDRGFSQRPPVLVVEVISPTDRPNRLSLRVAQYLARGVSLVWVVDPEARDVASHRNGRGLLLATRDEEVSGEDVLPGLLVRASGLFALPGR